MKIIVEPVEGCPAKLAFESFHLDMPMPPAEGSWFEIDVQMWRVSGHPVYSLRASNGFDASETPTVIDVATVRLFPLQF